MIALSLMSKQTDSDDCESQFMFLFFHFAFKKSDLYKCKEDKEIWENMYLKLDMKGRLELVRYNPHLQL
jgi:hypothetical protein